MTAGAHGALSSGDRSRHGGVDEIVLPPGVAGRLWLCGKHFIGPDPEAALRAVGADCAVCLNETPELADRYPGYVTWLLANQPDRAVWFPVPDLHAPSVDVALGLLVDLRARLDDGQRLLMHCGAGIGRAGTMVAGLLITMGLSAPEALDRVAVRPMAGPEAGAQVALIEALAARAG